MPNRILKESICTSDSIDKLSPIQEIFFYRLIVNCDDFGRMDARTSILRARLFPLKEYDDVSDYIIETTLDKLQELGLVTLYVVDGKTFLQMSTWDKHQQIRAKRSKYPSPEDCEMKQFARTCKQMISDDNKCPRNPIQSESESESESVSEPLIADADAQKIQKAHDRILTMSENAGFPKSPMVRAKLIELFAQYGETMLAEAIGECVIHSASNLAYLEAVLRGRASGSARKKKPRVAAQEFEQRDYQAVQDDFLQKQNDRIMQRLKGG